ncbi:hypothetical protein GGR53DRAFT_465960 [Hypoxylon sp. FL1150]|nr:hypothetical protein GGR53DRAFT_465960 [Hypoxylon sp. FL1150]
MKERDFVPKRFAGPSMNNFTVHVSRVTYTDNNYPQYETVSYMWAGEEGNSERPVYVGPYWDMLLQTENCGQLFRFLRPPRASRLIWIDSLRIHQADYQERPEQVAQDDPDI